MTTETTKLYTFSIPEIKEVLGVDKDLDKGVIQEKLQGFKQYPKFIYNLDDLKNVYDLSDLTIEKAKTYVEKRNVERGQKAQATRAANKAKVAKEEKKAKAKSDNPFAKLESLYLTKAKLKVEVAKLSREQNLLEKEIVDLEKELNVR